jgi:hypothetical protein
MGMFIDSESLDQLLEKLHNDGVRTSQLLDIRAGVLIQDPAKERELEDLARRHGFWHPEGRS